MKSIIFCNKKIIVGKRGCDATAVALNAGKDHFVIAREDKTFSLHQSNGDELDETFDTRCIALSLDWCPSSARSHASADLLAAACTDGTIRLMRKDGYITEKIIKSHDGAVVCAKWSPDGSSIATAGEDGVVKVWSKKGNLRTKLAVYNCTVHGIAWNSSNDAIAIAYKNMVCLHFTQKKKKANRWECHPADKGVVLCIDWSWSHSRIVCGGEDKHYRIFDSLGTLLFESTVQMDAITSLSWSPSGECFSIGSLGSVTLSSDTGHVIHHDFFNTGSVTQMKWDRDSTRLFGLCGCGQVIVANVTCSSKEWEGATVEHTELSKIAVHGRNDLEKEIEVMDRIIAVEMGYGKLVVGTSKQCHVYDIDDIRSTAVIDFKHQISSIIMSATNFALLSNSSLTMVVYSYDGRQMATFELQNQSGLFSKNISLSDDLISFVDQSDRMNVKILESSSGKKPKDVLSIINHDSRIECASLSRAKSSRHDCDLAIIDEKNDMYLCSIGRAKAGRDFAFRKLASHVTSLAWNEDFDFVAAISDSRVTIWYLPSVLFYDKDLFMLLSETRDDVDVGKNPVITSYKNSTVSILQEDGTKSKVLTSPIFNVIHERVRCQRWDDAVRLCRLIENQTLWAVLTTLSVKHQNLEVAKTALTALGFVDKLEYLLHTKSIL